MPALAALRERLLNLLFPPRCAGCGYPGSLLCVDCRQLLRPLSPPLCVTCGLPLPAGAVCRACREHPPVLDGIRSVYEYEPPLREAILAFKYRRLRALSAVFAPLLVSYLQAWGAAVELVAPVPLHPSRLASRGYNQAAELAAAVAAAIAVPCAPAALQRVRPTSAQARLTRAERWLNVQDAFRADPDIVRGRAVLVIDDVCTTGATVDACARALREAGAVRVWALTLARDV